MLILLRHPINTFCVEKKGYVGRLSPSCSKKMKMLIPKANKMTTRGGEGNKEFWLDTFGLLSPRDRGRGKRFFGGIQVPYQVGHSPKHEVNHNLEILQKSCIFNDFQNSSF